MSQRSKYCLVGIPDHQGVYNVGGRIGAAEGPEAFRRVWATLGGAVPLRDWVYDAGDVSELSSDVESNHRRATEHVREAHASLGLSIVVGGGHDHGYSQLAAIAATLPKRARLGCINIDAHLDLRKPEPLITSGSPFYLAIESGTLDPARLIEFGIQPHCNSPALWEYATRKKIEIRPFEELRDGDAVEQFGKSLKKLAGRCDAIVLSLCLDAAAQAFAPGVSAPQAEGFTPSEMVGICELAGASPKVVSLGVFELNPVHDIDGRTARLGATAAWHFLAAAHARGASRAAAAQKSRRGK